MSAARFILCLVAAGLPACAGSPPSPQPVDKPASRPSPPAVADKIGIPPGVQSACAALLEAAPKDWPERVAAVYALGPKATPGLLRALELRSEGPGAQAAIRTLGALGQEASRPALETWLNSGTPLAAAAALALGQIGSPQSQAPLQAVMQNSENAPDVRSAAAAALIALGQFAQTKAYCAAVFRAATPAAEPSTSIQGLPRAKVTWAISRYTLIEALRAKYPDTEFPLDEDHSWPNLILGAKFLETFQPAR